MKRIYCIGTSFEIGFQHGKAAQIEIGRSLAFYTDLFLRNAGLSWSEVCDTASKFNKMLYKDWSGYVEEMRGVASGAEVPYQSILALNVRTEIAYGMSKDGCTALYWKNEQSTSLVQNWDWQEEQKENLINLNINQPSKPAISMITEAGIIGKIGLNSSGVGVCLNAIRALGVNIERLPCHLALRACLESETTNRAVATLQRFGVASACHILVGDAHEAIGLECTNIDMMEFPTKGVLTHTNHFIKPHPSVEDEMALEDSPTRLDRINKLIEQELVRDGIMPLQLEKMRTLLADEENFPTAICRAKTEGSSVATLFSIVMDLKERNAELSMGRPSDINAETLCLTPRA